MSINEIKSPRNLVFRKTYLKFMYIRKLSNMKKIKCKLNNRWYWSIASAGLLISSPSGGSVWIPKRMADWTAEQKEVVLRVAEHQEEEIELTISEMKCLAEVAKTTRGGIFSGGGKNVAAPQKANVTSSNAQHISYAQRKFEKSKRIQDNNRKILGGCCPSCDQYKLILKRHTGWVGYFCKACNAGGSMSVK